MFKKIAFTMYPVLDIHQARKFYEETLGILISLIPFWKKSRHLA